MLKFTVQRRRSSSIGDVIDVKDTPLNKVTSKHKTPSTSSHDTTSDLGSMCTDQEGDYPYSTAPAPGDLIPTSLEGQRPCSPGSLPEAHESEDSCYMVESTQDSSSGIASDDHNLPDSSPTLSSGHEYSFSGSDLRSASSCQCSCDSRTSGCEGKSHWHDGFHEIPSMKDSHYRTQRSHATSNRTLFRYHETDLDNPGTSRTATSFSSSSQSRHSPHFMSSSVAQSIHQTTKEFLHHRSASVPLSEGLSGDLSALSSDFQHLLSRGPISYFDILPDDVVNRIFHYLPSDQLCRCARVCRRWYNLAWDPTQWTSIRINSGEVNADKAIKSLTKRLSYETPTVCAIVERINLNGCEKLTDKGLYVIARRCPELRHLELQGCPNISNIALFEIVSKCVNVEHLNVAGCACVTCICLTPEATVQAATYGKQIYLRYLDMTDCWQLDDAGLQIIASYCSKLVYLYLRRCYKISDIGVQYIANYCSSLKEFSISDCHNVTDFGLRELSKLESNLRYLSVAKCEKLSDVGIKYIARYCRRLRYLNVRGCEGVSDDSVELLARNCPKLKSLDVGKCDITDDGLQFLAEHCVSLRKLSLKSCDAITDRGIITVAHHCRHLQQLNIQDTNITPEAHKKVKKYCKRCVIEHTNPGFF